MEREHATKFREAILRFRRRGPLKEQGGLTGGNFPELSEINSPRNQI